VPAPGLVEHGGMDALGELAQRAGRLGGADRVDEVRVVV
jgi:hypothetical protein